VNPEKPEALFWEGSLKLGLDLGEKEITKYLQYLEALKRWNRSINLTAYTGNTSMVEHLFLDSLMGLRFLNGRTEGRMADLGTGAGFPGIPLQIHCPSTELTLIESSGRKVAFLLYIRGVLELKGLTIVNRRVEALSKLPEFQGRYDILLARAFAKPPMVVQMARPLLSGKGSLVLYVSPPGASEIGALDGWDIQRMDYTLPFSGVHRTLLSMSPSS
jgi:16S rRNA (guanine527-N7)-methyltransferase